MPMLFHLQHALEYSLYIAGFLYILNHTEDELRIKGEEHSKIGLPIGKPAEGCSFRASRIDAYNVTMNARLSIGGFIGGPSVGYEMSYSLASAGLFGLYGPT